jgi:hypothetical protein
MASFLGRPSINLLAADKGRQLRVSWRPEQEL